MLLVGVLWVMVLIIFVVVIHEASHAVFASIFSIHFDTVLIGLPFPPTMSLKLFGKTINLKPIFQQNIKVGNITLCLQPWLLGGGLNIRDVDLYQAPYWQMFLIAASGPMANIFSGLIIAIAFFGPELGRQVSQFFTETALETLLAVAGNEISLSHIVGPIGGIIILGRIVTIDPVQATVFIWLVLSITNGVVNLLPLPALDGGFIFWGSASGISKKSPKVIHKLTTLNDIFLVSLVFLLVLLTIKDIYYLIIGEMPFV